MPDEEEVANAYVRHEAPWVDFGGGGATRADPDATPAPGTVIMPGGAVDLPQEGYEPAAPPVAADPEFTILVRPRHRSREIVAGAVTAVVVLLAAWFAPLMITPATERGRVASYIVGVGGGLIALLVVWRLWHWATRRD